MFNPTDLDRCEAASAYDNACRTHFDPEYKPSDYVADGATVTVQPDGATYWVVTIAEARAVGITFDESETVVVNRRKWVVVLG
jgi:hypothetical protein